MENALEFDEFQQAIKALNCYQVTDAAIQDFFTQLDRQRRHRIAITEIEGLFKEHQRRSHPNIRPDDVCAGILRAFNGDAAFIEQ